MRKLNRRAATATLAAGVLRVGGAGIATAASSGFDNPNGPANSTGSVWFCYKNHGGAYVQFNNEPNGCQGNPGYKQVAVPRQSAGIDHVTNDDKGLHITYLDGHTKDVPFPEPQPGPKGDTGPAGPAGVSGYHVLNATVPVAAGESASNDVTCEADEVALGGGVTAPADTRGQGSETDLVTNMSGPVYQQLPGGGDGANAWHTVVTNNGSQGEAYLAWVTCAKVSEAQPQPSDNGEN